MDGVSLVYKPVILGSLREIARHFRVGCDTVRRWIEEGAPVAVERRGHRTRYSAEAASLQLWRLRRSRG